MTKVKPLLLTRDDLLAQLKFIRNKRQEYFICISLDARRRLITRRTITIGLVNSSLVHPREAFAGALKDNASSVVIAHNHPSGESTPSSQDISVTQQLIAAGILLGIPLRDHIIVTSDGYFSFREKELICDIPIYTAAE